MKGKEIRAALDKSGKSQRGLANALGLDPSGVHRLLNGRRRLKADELPVVQKYLAEPGRSYRGPVAVPTESFIEVPVLDVNASAGAGAVAISDDPIYTLQFREPWLRRVAGDLTQLFVLEISGDSMWETLHHGDHALVDRSQNNPRREGIYVIRIDDVLQVKRISMHPVSRLLTIKSDNASYPSYEGINPDEVSVAGRVIWIGRSL